MYLKYFSRAIHFSKMAVLWVLAPCSLVEFINVSEVLAASIIRATMEAARTSKTLVNFYQTKRCYNPEEAIFVFTVVRTSNPTSYIFRHIRD
jgi:hypothetical protein